MPKANKTHGTVRFNPMTDRFPSKPTLDTIQALSLVCQRFGGAPEPKLSLLEEFHFNVLLLKVHMTRAEAKPGEDGLVDIERSKHEASGVTLFAADIPALPFAQPVVPRLSDAVVKSFQHKGYHVCVPPSGDPTCLARVCWTRVDDYVGGWRVYAPTGTLEPLHVDADLHLATPRLEDCPEAWWAPIQHLHVSF